MKTNNIIYSILYAGLGLLAACSDETNTPANPDTAGVVNFTATLQTTEKLDTRADFDSEKGQTQVLPFVNGITIRKVQPSAAPSTKTPYNVKSANKGVLEYNGAAADALKWDKEHLNEPVDFFAWTTPSGVTIGEGDDEGKVDFMAGNTYNKDSQKKEDQLDNATVTPLEVLMSAVSEGNDYRTSPSVTLPFTHLVSKVSLYLRNWNSQHITPPSDVSIEFFSIPQEWKVAQNISGGDKAPFRVTEPVKDSKDLTLNFADLSYDDEDKGYYTFYLPPLTRELGTDFASAGDFCITYDGKRFYGTLASIPTAQLTELKAGQHILIRMDLSENYGVGVGATITGWKGPDKEDVIYANPNRGIYSKEGFKCLAEYLKNPAADKELTDTLYIKDGGQMIVRLYNDLVLTADDLGTSLTGIIFDGQGHTITLPDGANGLFSQIGTAQETTEVRNLYLKGGNITAQGMLANTTGNVKITNCHALAGSIVSETDAGGLIGTAEAGTVIEFCSSIIDVTGEGIVGGLVGALTAADASLNGCYAQAIVTGNGTAAGGLIGDIQAGKLTNCFFYSDNIKGTVEGTAANKGAIAGQADNNVTISQCYWGYQESSTDLLPSVGGTVPTLQKCSSFSTNDKKLKSPVKIENQSCNTLVDALRAGTLGKEWVWVYGKDYPVIKIK